MRSGQLGKPGHGMGREIYKFSYRRSHPWDLRLMGRAGYRYEVPRSSTTFSVLYPLRNNRIVIGDLWRTYGLFYNDYIGVLRYVVACRDVVLGKQQRGKFISDWPRLILLCTRTRALFFLIQARAQGCILLLASSGGRPSIACHTALYGLISSYGLRTARMHSAAAVAAAVALLRLEHLEKRGGGGSIFGGALRTVESNYNVDVTRQSNRGGDEHTTNPSGSLIVKVSTTRPCRYRSVDIGPANNERE
ncbi:hypothetical protein ALC56_10768 [Trachymyrmex septentrionalis]|uniref:Uncharacterized protein n=1 Tax=Trachymyrmex septentrionalis TaxID=34720 RepID=A0A195F2K3_9HYME|nr:hypothetical protein ALC56_10768 [Trachymyrmex septentrionalis]